MKRESLTDAPAHPKAGTIANVISKLVLGMVRHPEDCRIERVLSSEALTVNILPVTADYRIICGKGGRQIRALKLLGERMGDNANLLVEVNLVETFIGTVEDRAEFEWKPDFDVTALMEFLAHTLVLAFGKPINVMSDRPASDKLKLWVDVENDQSSLQLLSAIGDLFYPYTYRGGMYSEIKPESQRPKH